jgi:hypothetical protein
VEASSTIRRLPGIPAAARAGESLLKPWNRAVHSTMKFLNRRALARASLAIPRTLRFLDHARRRGTVADAVAAPSLSVGFGAQVAMDEALLAMAMTPRRFPLRADYQRLGDELGVAHDLYTSRGWLESPQTFHRTPPALEAGDLSRSKGWAAGLGYERFSFDSGFVPPLGDPGRPRWEGYGANHRASVVVLRHPGPPRPWVVCVHGFCMGFPFMDFQGLSVARLFRERGFNVALPVLPLHGPRRATRMSGAPFLSFELMNGIHGLAQSVWDIRRIIGWLRAESGTPIAAYGISLGGNVVALLAGLEPLDAVVAGVPVSDFPALFAQHSPRVIQERSLEHRILGGVTEDLYTVVSPFAFTPLVEPARRFIFAGYGDRLATAGQAQALHEHWGSPNICWYAGNHVGYIWSKRVNDYLADSLSASLPAMTAGAAG